MKRRPYAAQLRFDASDSARAIEPFGSGRALAASLGIAPERLIVRFVGPDPSRLGVTDQAVDRAVEADDVVVLVFDTARPWREGKSCVDATVLRCGWWRVPLDKTDKFRGPIPFTQSARKYQYESKNCQKAASLLFGGERFIPDEAAFRGQENGYMVVPLVGGAAEPRPSPGVSAAISALGRGGVPRGTTQMLRVYEVLVDVLPPVDPRVAGDDPPTDPPHHVVWQMIEAHLAQGPEPSAACRPRFNALARVLLDWLMWAIRQKYRYHPARQYLRQSTPLSEALRW